MDAPVTPHCCRPWNTLRRRCSDGQRAAMSTSPQKASHGCSSCPTNQLPGTSLSASVLASHPGARPARSCRAIPTQRASSRTMPTRCWWQMDAVASGASVQCNHHFDRFAAQARRPADRLQAARHAGCLVVRGDQNAYHRRPSLPVTACRASSPAAQSPHRDSGRLRRPWPRHRCTTSVRLTRPGNEGNHGTRPAIRRHEVLDRFRHAAREGRSSPAHLTADDQVGAPAAIARGGWRSGPARAAGGPGCGGPGTLRAG